MPKEKPVKFLLKKFALMKNKNNPMARKSMGGRIKLCEFEFQELYIYVDMADSQNYLSCHLIK